jgi:hypothetical protein
MNGFRGILNFTVCAPVAPNGFGSPCAPSIQFKTWYRHEPLAKLDHGLMHACVYILHGTQAAVREAEWVVEHPARVFEGIEQDSLSWPRGLLESPCWRASSSWGCG